MDSIKDIIFDAVGLVVDLRKETKGWVSIFNKGAEAINALLGKVKTTVRTVEKQTKRTVSGFDRLNRLEVPDVTVTTVVSKDQGALQTLKENLPAVIHTIRTAVAEFSETVTQKLAQFGSWESGNVLYGLSSILSGVAAVQALLKGDVSMAMWLGMVSAGISTAGNKVGALTSILQNVATAFSGVGSASSRVWSGISAIWGGAAMWFSNKFFGPLSTGTKGTVNLLIGLLNGVLSSGVAAVNAIGKILGGISFKVPSWIPLLGGKSFGFKLPVFTAPKIPYLATGAVLPANKPFLAMVGDQKHGTNIEAPLATIQEALALVLDDHTGAITAGFEASVGVQREILEAVLGIRIGDDLIAAAGDRYRQKMAVARGGAL